MGTLRRDSMVWRLLLLIGGAFAVTALAVFLVVSSLMDRVLHERGREVHGQRAESIVREFERQAERLEATGQEEAYRADFEDATLRRLAEVHYREANPRSFPFVVDGDGAILAHPWYPRGDLNFFDELHSPGVAGGVPDDFVYQGRDGQRHLAVVRHHEPWDWYVISSVPENVLAADSRQIKTLMLVVWGVISVLALVGLAWMLIRETGPLLTLADAAEAMALGDLDHDIDVRRSGEVGIVARGFIHMRDAIRRQMDELRDSEARYRKIFDAGTDGLLLLDDESNIVAANPAAGAMYGWTPSQLEGRPITALLRDGDAELAQALRSPPADKPVHLSGITCNRERQELETEISAVRLSFLGRTHAMVILRDVTAQRHLERQLLQSQKLESVGRLAGGIAHDFNNLLTPVLGYAEMLLDSDCLPDDARSDVAAIQRAGERARGLARQLLAFSRRQVLEMRNLDLAETIDEFSPILRRTLPEDIELVVTRCDGDCRVHADPSQIEQIVMNLVVNAMDVMPDGGRIELSIGVKDITDGDHLSAGSVQPGHYVSLSVRDSGPGVAPEIVDRVFEPFFTTKDVGKGTGLGLATIHGIVSQHDGWVSLRNLDDGGCEVEILLPCLPATASHPVVDVDLSEAAWMRGHDELIWVVEDDDMVRDLVDAMMRRHGYRVATFATAAPCLEAADQGDEAAHLVLTDVVMPLMNGPELRDALRARGFDMPVLFMSGYAGETLVRRGLADAHADFLNKPIDPPRLLQKIRQMLDSVRGRSG